MENLIFPYLEHLELLSLCYLDLIQQNFIPHLPKYLILHKYAGKRSKMTLMVLDLECGKIKMT